MEDMSSSIILHFTTALLLVLAIYANTAIATNASVEADELSLVTRYAGMGYNLLMANPEGDFNLGGVDPGIKTTNFIFKHTYSKGKKAFYRGQSLNVPDQVTFHASSSCAKSQTTNAFSGQSSYRKELSVNVEGSG